MGENIIFHKDLYSSGRWRNMDFANQMANIGSEVSRACRWKRKEDREKTFNATARGLELLDLTIAGEKGCRRHELLRLREVMCDFLLGDNVYLSDEESLKRYFDAFAVMSRR